MSFTIKCDKCGHTDKFLARKHRSSKRTPIIISTKTEGDVPDWYVMECANCGHKVEEI